MPDILPDSVKCGSRTLKPKEVPKGTAKPCGLACKQLTFTGDVSNNFDVKGNLLVYSHRGLGEDIYYIDLKTGKEYLVHDAPHGIRFCDRVATDGKLIGYSCTEILGGNKYLQSLRTFDLTTNTETDLECFTMTTGACRPSTIAMGSTGFAVNIGMSSCQYRDVHFHRFSDTSFTNLSQNPGRAHSAHISGSRLVWSDWPKSSYQQVLLHDTVAGTKKPLAPGPGHQFLGRIEGDQVVWMDTRNAPGGSMANFGNTDIYHHDLKTGKTVAATNHPATQEYPDVYGDWVVWTDWRNAKKPVPRYSGDFDNGDIYARNLKTGKEYQVTNFKNNELYPKVEDGKVYFRAWSDKGLDIFVIDLKKRLGL